MVVVGRMDVKKSLKQKKKNFFTFQKKEPSIKIIIKAPIKSVPQMINTKKKETWDVTPQAFDSISHILPIVILIAN